MEVYSGFDKNYQINEEDLNMFETFAKYDTCNVE